MAGTQCVAFSILAGGLLSLLLCIMRAHDRNVLKCQRTNAEQRVPVNICAVLFRLGIRFLFRRSPLADSRPLLSPRCVGAHRANKL